MPDTLSLPSTPPTSGRVAALEGVIAGGTVPGAVVLMLGYYMSGELDRLRDGIGAQLDDVSEQVSQMQGQLTDVRIQTAQLPALEARVRDLEMTRGQAAAAQPPRR